MTVAARPFIKWVGGKTYLLPEIKKRIPSAWNPETDLYVEPFVGAGVMFWDLNPKAESILNDRNEELILTYQVVRDHVDDLAAKLQAHELAYREGDPEQYYYSIRAQHPSWSRCVDLAARFIFLNKTCFNGLHRQNRDGQFNVPWGKDPNRTIFERDVLWACGFRLNSLYRGHVACELHHIDFADLIFDPKGALVYCDPPYVPISKTSNFTSYTADGFTYKDQLRLAVWAANLRDAGAHVILSQAAFEPLIDQYRMLGFTCDLVQVPRRVNSKGTGRGNVSEYIIY